ncbi:MAG: hypothetical protein HYU77_10330 [Betaproteobacteria bacterium]|nr:hypothetical protein [Betaproteobacteria bacterium]
MKLSKSNRFLRSSAQARTGLWVSAKTSSAVEGIRKPFDVNASELQPADTKALIAYWKRRASGSPR